MVELLPKPAACSLIGRSSFPMSRAVRSIGSNRFVVEAAPGVRATSRPPRPSSNAGGVGRDIELGRKGGRVAGHADTMYGSQDTVDPIIRASAALFAVVIDAGLRE